MNPKPIRHGLNNLRNFAGRERRGTFWKYVAAVVGGYGMAFAICMMAAMAAIFGTTGAGASDKQVTGKFTGLFLANSVLVAGAVGLLAAAVSRRLHDSGRRAYWGMLPLPFLLTAMILMPAMVGSFLTSEQPDMGLFGLMFLNNVVYLLMLGGLVTLLVAPGDTGENRFGGAPE